MVTVVVMVATAVVGALDIQTKSVEAGVLPAVAPPSVNDQLPAVFQALLFAPVQ
jgi:hypothetical protein